MPNIETEEQQRVHDVLMSVWHHEMSADDAFEELDPGVSRCVECGDILDSSDDDMCSVCE